MRFLSSMVRMTPVLLVLIFLLLPGEAYAQEAVISGTITDTTGAVLPGVTVEATHTASGNIFTAVTDQSGTFRLAVRTGNYTVVTELSGFAAANRMLTVLVGQNAQLNLQLMPSALQETVTVSGEAPLLNVESSTVSGNIDPRQMQELPVQGRNWQSLVLLAPGSHANSVGENVPVDRTLSSSLPFQLNMDGQQVTQVIVPTTFGNPKYSRDAIAEFQLVTNRFDATQGRSSGIQVNAITKSGTNTFTGTTGAYFRDDALNAADHITGTVLPYSDQQISNTLGGPIRKDRVHFFVNYEFEREGQNLVYQTPYPAFNQNTTGERHEHLAGGRLDTQFSPATRLAVRANLFNYNNPTGLGVVSVDGPTNTPAAPTTVRRKSRDVFATLTQVVNNRTVNEVKGGLTRYHWDYEPNAKGGVLRGTPRILLRNLTIGMGNQFSPQAFTQDTYSIRDDLTHSLEWHGRHDVKMGGENLFYNVKNFFCNLCNGQLTASIGAIPPNITSLFPNLKDATTWNLQPLSSIAQFYDLGVGDFGFPFHRSEVAAWLQDDWAILPRVTLNLGVRYDLPFNAFAKNLTISPLDPAPRPDDKNNVAPRLGFVVKASDRTVIRGGAGKFYTETSTTFFSQIYQQSLVIEVQNDGRPDFASDPFSGPPPTYEQAKGLLCTAADPFRPGCQRPSITTGVLGPPPVQIPYTYQASIGVQRQLTATMAVTADYMYNHSLKEFAGRNFNQTYNPATGANYNFSDLTHHLHPEWAQINLNANIASSWSHELQTTFTKRFSDRWQANVNYTLLGLWNKTDPPKVGFPLAPDMYQPSGLAPTDQRHRAVFNGIWDVGRGLQLSGLYFYSSGERLATTWGPDLRVQGANGEARLRPDGTIVPRDNFVGKPPHRVDLRLQQSLPIAGKRRSIEGILEVFNLFDHANFGSYLTAESSVRYGLPVATQNVAFAPRTLQLGVHVTF